MYQVYFYVPLDHKEAVKTAMFTAGAGRIGNYDACCFEWEGLGQFKALSGSNPFIGKQGIVEKVREVKVEMIVDDNMIADVIKALKEAHPYETPAYGVIKLESF